MTDSSSIRRHFTLDMHIFDGHFSIHLADRNGSPWATPSILSKCRTILLFEVTHVQPFEFPDSASYEVKLHLHDGVPISCQWLKLPLIEHIDTVAQ